MIPRQEFARLCALFALTVVANGAPALALSTSDSSPSDSKITALEVKLFSHAYSKDSEADRVARVERFVYGGTKNTGSVGDRIEALASAVNIRNVGEAPYLPKNKPMTEWTASSQIGLLPSSSYPRVSDLEQRLFGQTYSDQPIADRLNRLESKAFGRTSRSTDLAVRVDSLVSYVVPAPQIPSRVRTPGNSFIAGLPGTGFGSGSGNYRSNFFSLSRSSDMSGASGKAGSNAAFGSSSSRATELASISRSQHCTVVDQIEYLENNTFGKIRPNKSLQKRVDALEAKIYGAPKSDSDKDLSGRVAQLWSAANSTSNTNHSSMNRTGA